MRIIGDWPDVSNVPEPRNGCLMLAIAFAFIVFVFLVHFFIAPWLTKIGIF